MKRVFIISLLLPVIAWCTTYYKVTDPATGNAYYTTNIKYKGSGAVQIIDEKSGDKAVLQSSEVKEIKKEEFNQGVCAK